MIDESTFIRQWSTTNSGALFSDDRQHRYVLWRRFTDIEPPWLSKGWVAFVGLNPSTATEVENDPTVTRCINFAKSWGFVGMFMLNAFAFRQTKPKFMKLASDPVGIDNDRFIRMVIKQAKIVVACWGNHGSFRGRSTDLGRKIRCFSDARTFGLTKSGEPKHPLYLSSKTQLIPWRSINAEECRS